MFDQWTFKPQINEISSIIAPKTSIIEKTQDAYRKKALYRDQHE